MCDRHGTCRGLQDWTHVPMDSRTRSSNCLPRPVRCARRMQPRCVVQAECRRSEPRSVRSDLACVATGHLVLRAALTSVKKSRSPGSFDRSRARAPYGLSRLQGRRLGVHTHKHFMHQSYWAFAPASATLYASSRVCPGGHACAQIGVELELRTPPCAHERETRVLIKT